MVKHRQTIRRRNKRSRRSKRGGDGKTTAELIQMEEGQKYGENIRTPPLYNPLYNQVPKEDLKRVSPGSAARDRVNAEIEFAAIGKKYEAEIERQKEVKALQESLQNPTTAAEFFSTSSNKSCNNGSCNIMGGRKSRKHKRHSKKKSKTRHHIFKRFFTF